MIKRKINTTIKFVTCIALAVLMVVCMLCFIGCDTEPEGQKPEGKTVSVMLNGAYTQSQLPKVAPGDTISAEELPTPERNGYRFDGWYLDEALTEKLTVTTVPADYLPNTSFNLYAKWELLTVALESEVYELDGTAFLLRLTKGTYSHSVKFDSFKLVGDGVGKIKMFHYTDEEFKYPHFESEGEFRLTNLKPGLNKDVIRIYATSNEGERISDIYTLSLYIPYEVKISLLDEMGLYYERDIVVEGDSYYKLPEFEFADGIEFVGWKNSDGELVEINENGEILANDSCTLQLVVSYCEYTVKYDLNGGEFADEAERETTVTFASPFALSLPKSRGPEWEFVGWEVDGELVTYALGTGEAWHIARNVTAVARWQYASYSVSVKAFNTSIANTYGSGTYTYGDEVTVTAERNATWENYTWLGWFDGDDKLSSDMTYTFVMPAKNVNYVAKWIECPLTVTYSGANPTIRWTKPAKVGDTVHVDIVNQNAWSNYYWYGWFDGDTLVSTEMDIDVTVTEAERTLTAVWQKCEHFVDSKSDNICDLCDTAKSFHVCDSYKDQGDDGSCDNCGKAENMHCGCTECEDADGNHRCDECNEWLIPNKKEES